MNNLMKRISIFFLFAICTLSSSAQDDIVILRDGNELKVNIIQVDNDGISYNYDKKSPASQRIDLKDIYMMHFNKRGNIYINSEGKRVTGENQKIGKGQDIIYLVSGKEIPCYEAQIFPNKVTYLLSKRGNTKVIPIAEVFALQEVFMIKYSDGMREIVTPLSKAEEEVKEPEPEPEPEIEDNEPKMQVVFHNVKRGETLEIIAEKYNVTPSDIIEWNDLPKNLRPKARLRADMQLMLYVLPNPQ